MAARLTSRERAEVYRQIFLLNRFFNLIVQRLDVLAHTRIFRVSEMREVRGLAQEVQLEINTTLLGPLDSLEHDDWGEFGKVRIAMEKRLRDPDDVFIHAEERRKELARQGRKSCRRTPASQKAVLRPEKRQLCKTVVIATSDRNAQRQVGQFYWN